VGILGLRPVGLRVGDAIGAKDGLSTGAAVAGAFDETGSIGELVSLLLGDASGLEVGPSGDDSVAGDCVGLFSVMSVGLREGEGTGGNRALTGAAVPGVTGRKGGNGSVGAFVSLLLGDASGLEVGPPVDDPTSGDCVGLSPVMASGLREGEATGGIDRASTGAIVCGPS
jgi:hypothetical protein